MEVQNLVMQADAQARSTKCYNVQTQKGNEALESQLSPACHLLQRRS
jgi:hypothetical protein